MFFVIRYIGRKINSKVADGGINKSLYVDIGRTKQWINIYGESLENPVLLYLHGGPGSATSELDYAFTRKWTDIFTVVTWDQRNCGKSYDKNQNDIVLTRELFINDGREITEFLLKYLRKEKITLLGHSWGSIYGANLVLEYPEYYDRFIGVGQLVDNFENEKAFKEAAKEWTKKDNNQEMISMVNKLTPEKVTTEHFNYKNQIMAHYGYDMMRDGSDYNLFATILFNPNYSLKDWIQCFKRDHGVYFDFMQSPEFSLFSIKNRKEYKVPYYNINGNNDYQTNYIIAQNYFNEIKAPKKEIYIMENTTHGLLESKSEDFSEILHSLDL